MTHARMLSFAAVVSALLATAAVAQPPQSDSTPPAANPAAAPAAAPAGAADPAAGQGLFAGHCAICHDSGAGGAPDRMTLAMKSPTEIFGVLKMGPMMAMASGLSDDDMHNIAAFLTTPAK